MKTKGFFIEMKSKFNFYILMSFLIGFTFCVSCKEETKTTNNSNPPKKQEKNPSISNISSPKNASVFTWGNEIQIEVNIKDSTQSIDSVEFRFAGNKIFTDFEKPFEFSFPTNNTKVGKQKIQTTTYKSNGKKDFNAVSITLLSDIEPKKLPYKLIKTYKHDTKAYTQGLEIADDFLYEGTGQWGQSELRKVELNSGKVLQSVSLENKFFGEGITVFQDKIYQLTWRSRKGFIYDKKTFNKQRNFQYPTEGWGMTHSENQLIMSDGSENLFYLDPTQLVEINRLQVYDNKQKIDSLNELEFVDGKIYANIYQRDEIAVIEAKTGKLLAWIDLKGILNPMAVKNQIDVLNGIAYHPERKTFFVTGKYWPQMFEISF